MPASKNNKSARKDSPHRFEAARLESLFVVLDAIAWMDAPSSSQIAQYAAVDPRTAGKLLKNARQIGLVEPLANGHVLLHPYPYKGSIEAKKTVVRDALFRLPLLRSVRQFLGLGDGLPSALRKAATVNGIVPYVETDIMPIVSWAQALGALDVGMVIEDLLTQGEEAKAERHRVDADKRVAFLSHSSKDKAFIRQLAADLNAEGISVWLDEQRIRVGDSIPDQVSQGVAESDIFLVAVSQNSIASPWVKKELGQALVKEIESRKTRVFPMKLDQSTMPESISDKLYADFSTSYKTGLHQVLNAIKTSVT